MNEFTKSLPLLVVDRPGQPECTEEGLADPGPMTPERMARIARGLAHPVRVGIIDQFRCCTPHIAKQIVAETDLAQSTVSEHLRILREADLIFARRDGPRTWYCLRRSVLRDYARAVKEMAREERSEAD